tara:strand:+ start:96 stop:422 length:327 start_codon:yes stop_codon:yes gene_type:complete
MEDQIIQAEKTYSISGLACKVFSIIGIVGTLIYILNNSSQTSRKFEYLIPVVSLSLTSSVSLAALGSLAESSKKNKALTALLVKTTNSASQLPLTKNYEYSEYLEDTE